jgi:hypothetical protein
MPLFISSICIIIIHAHLLLPPPLLQCKSPLLLSCLTRHVDWAVYYVSKNDVPSDANVVQDGVHPTLFEEIV